MYQIKSGVRGIFLGFCLFVLFVLGLLKINKDIYTIWNSNLISVSAEIPLSSDKVKIGYGICINCTEGDYIIIYDGKTVNKIENAYGENNFIVQYDDKYFYSFRQFKFNCNHQHDYYFHLYRKQNKLFVKVDVSGKDGMMLEQEMLEIRDLKSNNTCRDY
jgi:hypothetical protein